MTIRIIVRYCSQWGNFITRGIELQSIDNDTKELFEKIQQTFNIPINQQILKYKKDGYTLRIIQGWSIQFYDLNDKSIVYLERISDHNTSDNLENNLTMMDGYKMQGKYYAKLGILTSINEDEEDGEEDKEEKIIKRKTWNKDITNIDSNSTSCLNPKDANLRYRSVSLYNIIPNNAVVEKLIMYTKNGDLNSIQEIFSRLYSSLNSIELNISDIKKLIDHKHSCGWNALHFAVFFGFPEILKYFLEKNADINHETNDGWTPLQLAIHRNHYQIAEIILRSPRIKVDFLTSRGSALHIAAKTNKLDFVKLLISHKADIYLQNGLGELPSDLSCNQEIKSTIEQASFTHKDWYTPPPSNKKLFEPPKPPIVKGWMYKKGRLFQLSIKRRYFVLNPDEGTFIRYKRMEDFPNKPIEVIPLKDILSVKRTRKGWFDKQEYYYLELQYTSRYIFATKLECAINEWVKYIYQGTAYTIYIEEELNNNPMKCITKAPNNSSLLDKNKHNLLEINDNPEQETSQNKDTKPKFGLNLTCKNLEDQKVIEQKSDKSSLYDKKLTYLLLKSNNTLANTEATDHHLGNIGKIINEKVSLKAFDVLRILGSGAFGKVYKVRRRDTNEIYAIKALKKSQLLIKNQLRYAITECNVLKNANHPFILSLHYAFQTPKYLYLVIDYCPKGDLSLHLAQKRMFTEDETRFYIAELILAIEHLHSMNVIYRDLKPENILIAEDGHIKLADFGLAKEGIEGNNTTNSFCGSPAYLSPEMLKKKNVGKAADIYGIGTVLYEMLVGKSPFYCDDIRKMYGYIQKAKLTFPIWLSETAKSLIRKLMNRDPSKRPGVQNKIELRSDPFFKGIDWQKVLRKEYKPPLLYDFEDSHDNYTLNNILLLKDEEYDKNNQHSERVPNFTFVK